MAKYVAVKTNEGITIHFPHPTGNYDTLCNMDGDDPKLGHYLVPVPKGERVNCDECFRIWLTAQTFTIDDFAAPNNASSRHIPTPREYFKDGDLPKGLKKTR